MAKLEVSAPDPYLVERYLEEIARTYDVVWASSILAAEQEDASDDDSDGGLNEVRTTKFYLSAIYLSAI